MSCSSEARDFSVVANRFKRDNGVLERHILIVGLDTHTKQAGLARYSQYGYAINLPLLNSTFYNKKTSHMCHIPNTTN